MPAEIGQPAPEFTLKDQNGADVSLADFRGQKAVALVFYPFTFTGVCEGELCQLRDDYAAFEAAGVQVLAVSCDSRHAQRVWAERNAYTFPVLSDFWPHGEVSRAFGVFDASGGHPTRSSFLVDAVGVVRWSVHSEMGRPRDLDEHARAVAALQPVLD